MPGGNHMGPAGMGPMTGRGAGFCAGCTVPGYANRTGVGCYGRGFGCGFKGRHHRMSIGVPGRAHGGHGAYGYGVPFDEKVILRDQAAFFERRLSQVKERLSDLCDDAES